MNSAPCAPADRFPHSCSFVTVGAGRVCPGVPGSAEQLEDQSGAPPMTGATTGPIVTGAYSFTCACQRLSRECTCVHVYTFVVGSFSIVAKHTHRKTYHCNMCGPARLAYSRGCASTRSVYFQGLPTTPERKSASRVPQVWTSHVPGTLSPASFPQHPASRCIHATACGRAPPLLWLTSAHGRDKPCCACPSFGGGTFGPSLAFDECESCAGSIVR